MLKEIKELRHVRLEGTLNTDYDSIAGSDLKIYDVATGHLIEAAQSISLGICIDDTVLEGELTTYNPDTNEDKTEIVVVTEMKILPRG